MTIRPPRPADLPALVEGFNLAFSNYSVPMTLTPKALESLVVSRGIDWARSRVALDGGEIRGFWLTGLEERSGGLAAYDIATGVAPSHRRRGLARRLFEEIEPALVDAGAASCSLEVIADNHRAVELYRGLGFVASRRLLCYAFEDPIEPWARPEGFELEEAERPDWSALRRFWDWVPSWPSGIGTVERSAGDATILVARREGTVAGYAATVRSARNLAQLAVAPAWRRRGLGRFLLAAAARSAGNESGFRVLNVPEDARPSRHLLERTGATVFTTQLEMRRDLGAEARREGDHAAE